SGERADYCAEPSLVRSIGPHDGAQFGRRSVPQLGLLTHPVWRHPVRLHHRYLHRAEDGSRLVVAADPWSGAGRAHGPGFLASPARQALTDDRLGAATLVDLDRLLYRVRSYLITESRVAKAILMRPRGVRCRG